MAILSDILLFIGALFCFIAALGLIRMPDLLLRMHAAAKAGTLGAGFILIAAVLYFQKWSVTIEIFMAIFFLILSAPVAFHLIAIAAFRNKIKLTPKTIKDSG